MGLDSLTYRAVVFLLLASLGNFCFQNCSEARFGSSDKAYGGQGSQGGAIGPGDPPGGGNPPPDDVDDPADPDVGCGPNLIHNGDFEVVDSRAGLVHGHRLDRLAEQNLWDVYGSIPSWEAEAGTSGIEVLASTVVPAISGKHYVELDSHPNQSLGSNTNSGMLQSLFVTAADRYVLSFLYRGRTHSPVDNGIDVFIDDSLVGHRADGQMATWQKVKIHLNLASGPKEILFRATGAATTLGGLVDRISLRLACK